MCLKSFRNNIFIAGPIISVAEAMYIAGQSIGAETDTGLASTEDRYFSMGFFEFRHPSETPIISCNALHPEPLIPVDHDTMGWRKINWGPIREIIDRGNGFTVNVEKLGGRKIARVATSVQSDGGSLYPILLELSSRCPEVHILVASFNANHSNIEGSTPEVMEIASYHKGAWEDIAPLSKAQADSNVVQLKIPAKSVSDMLTYVFSGFEKHLKLAYESLPPVRRDPAEIGWHSKVFGHVNRLGPEGFQAMLRSMVRSQGMHSAAHLPIHIFDVEKLESGLSVLDAAVAAPFAPLLRLPPGQHEATPNSPLTLRPDESRLRHLASLCAEDEGMARFLATDFGLLSTGLHVAALMARVCPPYSTESVGLSNILRHATFALPRDMGPLNRPFSNGIAEPTSLQLSDETPAAQRAEWMRERTVMSLAVSGNPAAWDWVLDTAAQGRLPGVDLDLIVRNAIVDAEGARTVLERYGIECLAHVDLENQLIDAAALEAIDEYSRFAEIANETLDALGFKSAATSKSKRHP
jgi:hypothetical protein